MELLVASLVGFFVGALAMWGVVALAHRRWSRPVIHDELYAACVRAVHRHFMNHDTLNVRQLERMMDLPGMTALRYLDRLERERIVKLHGHRGAGAFYTHA